MKSRMIGYDTFWPVLKRCTLHRLGTKAEGKTQVYLVNGGMYVYVIILFCCCYNYHFLRTSYKQKADHLHGLSRSSNQHWTE